MKRREETGQPFSVAVAPILVAFTLPTIALIVTSTAQLPLKDLILALFVASTGVLLAGFQFAVGRFSNAGKFWDGARATLTSLGLILLGAALALLLWPWPLRWPWRAVTNREVLCTGLALLAAGILLPTGIKLYLWATDIISNRGGEPESVDAIVDVICRGSPADQTKALSRALSLLPDLEESDRSRLSSAAELLNMLDKRTRDEAASIMQSEGNGQP
jgi:hypothetical protein